MSEIDYKPTQLMVDWEKALRTPGLKQTVGALCREGNDGTHRYCCLGVLEIVAGNTPKRQDDAQGYLGEAANNLEFHGPTAFGETGLPDQSLVDELLGQDPEDVETKLSGIYLGVDYWGARVEAAALNDEYGWSFEQIAEQIRKVYIDGDGDFTKHEIDLGTGCDDRCEYY